MAKSGYEEGKGLGLKLQGGYSSITVLEKAEKFGLGYKESLEEKLASVNLSKKHKKSKIHQIPHLKETFPAPTEVVIAENVVHP